MARKSKDVFGFDEFEKAMLGMQKRYDDASTAFIAAGIRQGKKRAKQVTPKVKGELYKGWKEKKPKDFKGGKVKVGLLYNNAPHGHLYEYPHNVKSHGRIVGRTKGHGVLEQVTKEFETRINTEADRIIDKITREVEI